MPSSGVPVPVIDNAAEHRFEAGVNGDQGQLVYRRHGQRLVLVHTEVPEPLRGQGQGGRLVEAAVEAAAAGGLTVVPLCTFAYSWLRAHADMAGRAEIDWQRTP
jgi:hypothetical protein